MVFLWNFWNRKSETLATQRFALFHTGVKKEVCSIVSKKDQLESEVEKYLREQVEKCGGKCVKFIPDFSRGFPDRIVILPHGVLVWVETKRPVGGHVDPAQNVQHVILRRLGQRVEVVWTKEEADALLKSLCGGSYV
jgi:hypothetical protein